MFRFIFRLKTSWVSRKGLWLEGYVQKVSVSVSDGGYCYVLRFRVRFSIQGYSQIQFWSYGPDQVQCQKVRITMLGLAFYVQVLVLGLVSGFRVSVSVRVIQRYRYIHIYSYICIRTRLQTCIYCNSIQYSSVNQPKKRNCLNMFSPLYPKQHSWPCIQQSLIKCCVKIYPVFGSVAEILRTFGQP